MPKDETAVQDAGAPEAAPDAAVAAAAPEGSGDVSTASTVTLTREALAAHVAAAVDRWRSTHLYNSPVSRSTGALNYLNLTAVPDLEAMILKEIF